MPGTTPMLKKNSVGMRYTNAGIVCMKSIIGRMMPEAIPFEAARTPKGRAMIIAMIAATRVSEIVSIVRSHISVPMLHDQQCDQREQAEGRAAGPHGKRGDDNDDDQDRDSF